MKMTIREAAEFLGVSVTTLRRWEKEGKLKPDKTIGQHRRYDQAKLSFFKDKKENKSMVVAYCRVSSADQKEDLERQVEKVSTYCIANGYSFQVIKDIGSGLNYNKKGLKELISLIETKQIQKIVILYKDRLIRFGYEMIEEMCAHNGVEIEVINHTEDKTYEEELVEDVLSIITVFSAKLYGSRSHKAKNAQEKFKEIFS